MNTIKRISPDPVIDAVVDIRFTSLVPEEAVYGALYNALRVQHPKTESLPITQLPEALRLKDPSLRFKPWYRLAAEGYTVSIGPDVITINCDCSEGYRGWEVYREDIQRVLDGVGKSQVLKNITRIGVRYISFFAGLNIFDNVNVSITRAGQPFTTGATTFTTIIEENALKHRLSLNNDVRLRNKNASNPGSVIDIDTFQEEGLSDISGALTHIEDAHHREKSLFFSLLDRDFLNTLNPEYE